MNDRLMMGLANIYNGNYSFEMRQSNLQHNFFNHNSENSLSFNKKLCYNDFYLGLKRRFGHFYG